MRAVNTISPISAWPIPAARKQDARAHNNTPNIWPWACCSRLLHKSWTFELILRSTLRPTGQPGNTNHDVPDNPLGTSQTCYEWWPEGSVTTLITEQRDATMPVRAADAPPAVPLGLLGIPLTQENAPSRGGLIRICILTSLIVANTCSTQGRLETHVPVSISSRPGRRRRVVKAICFYFIPPQAW